MLRLLIFSAAVSGLSVLAGAGPTPEAPADKAPEAVSGLVAGPAPAARPIALDRRGDARDHARIREMIETFIRALSHRQAAPVWALAPETMQKRLKDERTALTFFSRVHPQLAAARSVSFDGVRMIGKVPVAGAYVTDTKGRQWLALFGVARRSDGSFNITFCQISAARGILI